MIVALAALALAQHDNTLSHDEHHAGWKLLFDGKTTQGWHNYKVETIGAGWVIKDGVLTSADPEKAGDIVTTEMFDWFELKLDFMLSKGGNSGVMFRIADGSEATWHSGPEVQLYDHPVEAGQEITGYLYQLYASKVDAQKPAGEWNTMRIVVAPDKCMTFVNDVKYYEYVYGSADFWARVAKSKFAKYAEFGKAATGRIGLQGDHGVVSFRNIKIRPIKK